MNLFIKPKIEIGNPIRYDNEYYIISDITVNNYGTPSNIVLGNISKYKKGQMPLVISPNDINIKFIDKKNHEKLISYLKFIERYNRTITYLIKKKGNDSGFTKLVSKLAETEINLFIERCKLKMSQLNKIENMLKKSQSNTLQLKNIMKNPFDFITEDYQLFSFKKAENICDEFKLNIDFKIKCKSWSYDLFLGINNSFYLLKWKYIADFNKFCASKGENKSIYFPYVEQFLIDKTIDGNVYKTTKCLLKREKDITDLCMDLFYDKKYNISIDIINDEIIKYEKQFNIVFEPEQKKSIHCSINNKLSIITGPPGTGKTEIIKCINTIFYNLYKNQYPDDDEYDGNDDEDTVSPSAVSLIAPTGLAFNNMKYGQAYLHFNEKISGTCHRFVYHTFENIIKHLDNCNCKNDDNSDDDNSGDDNSVDKSCDYNLNVKLFIIDEVSMIDILMFHEILKICHYFNARLIMIGDVRQLASIGPGTVLKSLIESKCFDVEKLKKIRRQNKGSLVDNIMKMNQDIIIDEECFNDDTMEIIGIQKFIKSTNGLNKESILELIRKYDLTVFRNKSGGGGDEDIIRKKYTKFITYHKDNKFVFNSNLLNNILQEEFNSSGEKIPSKNKYNDQYIFCVGDTIIRTENDYSSDTMRANGEEAYIIEYDGLTVTIVYEEGNKAPIKIGIEDLYESFALNYCITIHKSQGSQYDNVVLFIEPGTKYMDKSALYTAISRAKYKCIIITDINDFLSCQKNNSDGKKVSLLMRESDKYELL